MNRPILTTIVILFTAMLAIPAILVTVQAKVEPDPTAKKKAVHTAEREKVDLIIEENAAHIPVYLSEEERIVQLPLEAYVRGVVAAEMPADFHIEALKAQALAARTYIIDRVARQDFSDMVELFGEEAKEAWVSDTVQHQVFYTEDRLRENWGARYDEKISRVNQAVNETKGKVLTYDGRPIVAAFFSTSNGKTENSEDYWEAAYPYLRSVDSSWDKDAPSYKGDPVVLTIAQLAQKLEQYTGKPVAVSASTGSPDWIDVVSKTEGGNVAKVKIGDQTYTGREVREALDLRSSDFSWKIEGDRVTFETRGYGHGVGMSQWGANLMAEEGKTAEDIVAHYYQGVRVEDYRQWVHKTDQPKSKKG